MAFKKDNEFSKHKDLLLKDYWCSISYEGRYVLTGSEFLQKTHGIDIIMQTVNDVSDVKIDTKHIRGTSPDLCIEEMSCTVEGREKLGWLLKGTGHPDYIIHVFNPLCNKCYDDCSLCDKPIRSSMVGYISAFTPLRNWFLENNNNYPLRFTKQMNKTSMRYIPINVLESLSITKLCNL